MSGWKTYACGGDKRMTCASQDEPTPLPYQNLHRAILRPAPPRICGTPGGPPITSPRIKLKDGRHLAYKEYGVPREEAKYKIVFVHGFSGSRHDANRGESTGPPAQMGVLGLPDSLNKVSGTELQPSPTQMLKQAETRPREFIQEHGIYVMGFDKPDYGLARAGLLSPVVNYCWPSFPAKLSTEAYYQEPFGDQLALRVAHYVPWLTYWCNTQKLFPSSSAISPNLVNSDPEAFGVRIRAMIRIIVRDSLQYFLS
ncbi:hypothetical protein L484_018340 [Morus notabilis]|uniref:Uncharacterized protein n=1 Tax=Morus notabilis TaxID=981085 RepID=W9QNV0_9ROSA|nr:hypothetical protein L484_018340 [Morus notabilis]